jgi:hypothetical protein
MSIAQYITVQTQGTIVTASSNLAMKLQFKKKHGA